MAARAPVKVAVLGAAGKMGRAIVRALVDEPGARLVAAVDRAGAPEGGQDVGVLAGLAPASVSVSDRMPRAKEADVWIDFSSAAAARNTPGGG
jgi:4-hydroxy-tetrahydrodipicolinate reductase